MAGAPLKLGLHGQIRKSFELQFTNSPPLSHDRSIICAIALSLGNAQYATTSTSQPVELLQHTATTRCIITGAKERRKIN